MKIELKEEEIQILVKTIEKRLKDLQNVDRFVMSTEVFIVNPLDMDTFSKLVAIRNKLTDKISESRLYICANKSAIEDASQKLNAKFACSGKTEYKRTNNGNKVTIKHTKDYKTIQSTFMSVKSLGITDGLRFDKVFIKYEGFDEQDTNDLRMALNTKEKLSIYVRS